MKCELLLRVLPTPGDPAEVTWSALCCPLLPALAPMVVRESWVPPGEIGGIQETLESWRPSPEGAPQPTLTTPLRWLPPPLPAGMEVKLREDAKALV